MKQRTTLNYDIISNIFIDNGYEILEYNNISAKSYIKCKDKYGYIYKTNYDNLIHNFKPRMVHKSNPYTIYNIKLWCKFNNKPFELLSEVYKTNYDNLQWKCLKEGCREQFESTWSNVFHPTNPTGCPFCRGLKVGLSNCLATKNPKLAAEWYLPLNDNITPYDITCKSNKKFWWYCGKCGHLWYTTVAHRTEGNGCPECSESKGEIRIKEWLRQNNINSFPQKEFEGLIGLGGKNLSYDFYLPQYNILIEYQGKQHEKYIPGFHKSKEDFEKQQEHDKRKKKYAQKYNIKLLEIWYWDFDNIEKILQKELLSEVVNIA